jgi:hypothetical protein
VADDAFDRIAGAEHQLVKTAPDRAALHVGRAAEILAQQGAAESISVNWRPHHSSATRRRKALWVTSASGAQTRGGDREVADAEQAGAGEQVPAVLASALHRMAGVTAP